MFLSVEEDVCDLGDVDAVSALLQKPVVFMSVHNGKFNNCALLAWLKEAELLGIV